MGTDQKAIDEADVCLFLYDARAGLQPYDEHFADILRRSHKPVVLLANKCEGRQQEDSRFEAYKLGLGEPIPFSAEHGLGMLDLYDALKEHYYPEENKSGQKADEENAEKALTTGKNMTTNARFRWQSSAVRTSANRRWSTPFCRTNGC